MNKLERLLVRILDADPIDIVVWFFVILGIIGLVLMTLNFFITVIGGGRAI